MRNAVFLLLVAAILGLLAFSHKLFPPESITSDKVYVRDGDTLTVGGRALRLDVIDAPEYLQTCKDASGADWSCGKAARELLVAMTRSESVACTLSDADEYGRTLATCRTRAVLDLAEAMVSAGLATTYDPYIKSQGFARAAKRGIWQGTFDEPAVWRAAHPREDTP